MAAIQDILVSQATLYKQVGEEPGGSLVKEDDLDLSFLIDITFIETIDLSGPRLILTIDDPTHYVADKLGTKPRDVLEITFSSKWYADDTDGVDLKLQFRILSMPQEGRKITFNCIEKEVESIKQPWPTTVLFANKPVSAIVSKLLPKLKPEIGKFPVVLDYHVLPGMRPAKTMRQMCHEMKATCFNRRKSLVFETWEKLLAQAPAITFKHKPPPKEQCREEIIQYQMLRTQAVVKDRCERNFMSFNITDGFIATTKAAKKPAEWSASPDKGVLDNMLTVPMPSIDMVTTGIGSVRAGVVMSIVWHSDNQEQPIDESLPDKVLISTVAHYYGGSSKYLCRVKGIRLD